MIYLVGVSSAVVGVCTNNDSQSVKTIAMDTLLVKTPTKAKGPIQFTACRLSLSLKACSVLYIT